MLNSGKNVGAASTPLNSFWTLMLGFRREYGSLVLVSSVLSAIEGILHPLLIKVIFDEVALKHESKRFMVLVLGYLALGLFLNLASIFTALWSKSLENRIVKAISGRMLMSYYDKEYSSVLRQGHGYFITRIYGDLREGLLPMLLLIQSTITQSALLLSLSLVLVYLSWQAFFLLAAIIPISAAVGTHLGKKIKLLTSEEREQEGSVLAILSKALNAFRVVRSFDLIPQVARAFDHRLEGYLSVGYNRYKTSRIFQTLNSLTMVISDFFSMFVGALFVLRGALSFGGYLAFVNSFWRAVTTLMQVFNRMADFHAFGAVAERMASFLSSPMSPYYRKGVSVSATNVEFSYTDTPVLRDFSLQLSPQERVVIVGPNGSGKTTLANILSGYMAPSKGEVVLPEKISSVTLPIAFPPLKVRDLISDHILLTTFNLGNKGVLEAFADELSTGQQQKLAIALVLSQEADLYLIDEPLTNLDSASKQTAINLILERTKGKSLILVMHGSEECYELFDRIINIDMMSETMMKV
jgi:ABC-type bacteriocin/lantibiotic exporter with double-glycine peptidase domain